jgi:hypothetical protein
MLLVQAGKAVDDFIATLVRKFIKIFFSNFIFIRFHYLKKVISSLMEEIPSIKIQWYENQSIFSIN